jgi:hypothetical protein
MNVSSIYYKFFRYIQISLHLLSLIYELILIVLFLSINTLSTIIKLVL